MERGVINAATPANGQFGTYTTITGERLLGGGKKLTSVSLNGVAVRELVSASNTELRVRAAKGSVGTGDIVLCD